MDAFSNSLLRAFFDRGSSKDKIPFTINYVAIPFGVVIAVIIALFYLNQAWLVIPYFYLRTGILLAVIPLILFLMRFPYFWRRFVIVSLYFSFLLLSFEFVALKNGQWVFPGKDFIGFVSMWGYRFPVEELFIWIICATPGLVAYYEFFADDRKIS